MTPQVKAFARNALRRASYRWPGRYNTFKAARVGRNQYRCAICNGIYKKKEIALDHKSPAVDPRRGWESFDKFIERLFVDESGFQVLCKAGCHAAKTENERQVRTKTRRRAKLEGKRE